MHQRQRGQRPIRIHPLLGTSVGLHSDKGQGVGPVAAGKLKGSPWLALGRRTGLGLQKAVIHRLHQRLGGAVVDRQRIVAPFGGLARLQVAVNVGTTKAVDGLFGVTNQQQGALGVVVRRAVDACKQAVLQRRGVLKLINQRHRVLAGNALAQALAAGAVQRGVQAFEHVSKTKRALLLLELAQALRHAGSGVAARGGAGLGQGLQRSLQGGEGRKSLLLFRGQMHRPGTVFANLGPGCVVQTRPAGGQRRHHLRVLPVGPVLQLV